MKHTSKELGLAHIAIIALVIVVIAAAAFGGWWVWESNKNDQDEGNNALSQNNQEGNVQPPEGWKFYKNDDAGFSFYYPPEWGEVKKTSEETQQLGAGKFYKFTSIDKLKFSIHGKERKVDSLEFGNIEPAVIDVFLENNQPVVKLSSGFKAFREFTNDQIVRKLAESKICLAEDYNAEDYVESPNPEYGYTFFGYCGLIDSKFGAFTISSGQRDSRKSETQISRENISGLLKTFKIY